MSCFRILGTGRRSHLRRYGFNLIEMLTVILVIGTLLSLSASVLEKAGKAHVSAVRAVAQLRSLAALENRIRYDAGMSVSMNTSSEDSIVLTRDAGLPIRYRVVKTAVVREVLDLDKIVGAERWRFSNPPELHFELKPSPSSGDDGHTEELPRLQMTLKFPDLGEMSNTVVIVARVGCLRFATPPEASPKPSENSPKPSETSPLGPIP